MSICRILLGPMFSTPFKHQGTWLPGCIIRACLVIYESAKPYFIVTTILHAFHILAAFDGGVFWILIFLIVHDRIFDDVKKCTRHIKGKLHLIIPILRKDVLHLPAIISDEFFTFSVFFQYFIFTNANYWGIQKRNLNYIAFPSVYKLNLHKIILKLKTCIIQI